MKLPVRSTDNRRITLQEIRELDKKHFKNPLIHILVYPDDPPDFSTTEAPWLSKGKKFTRYPVQTQLAEQQSSYLPIIAAVSEKKFGREPTLSFTKNLDLKQDPSPQVVVVKRKETKIIDAKVIEASVISPKPTPKAGQTYVKGYVRDLPIPTYNQSQKNLLTEVSTTSSEDTINAPSPSPKNDPFTTFRATLREDPN